ncbi:MAG: LTA synthase family protein [Thiohalospira sp.]
MISGEKISKIILPRLLKFLRQQLPCLNEFGLITSILFLEFVLIRFFEFFYLSFSFGFPFSNIIYTLKGIYYDFVFVSIIAILSIIPFLIVYRYLEKIIRPLFYIFIILVVLLSLILIDYLRYTFTPLDHALFAYPFKELVYITQESVNFGFLQLIKYIIALALSIFLMLLFFKKASHFKYSLIGIIFLLGGIFLSKNINPARRNYPNELSFNLTINKLSFFSKSSANYLLGKAAITQIEFLNEVKKYHNLHNNIKFINNNYPLEHVPVTTDKLGDYFQLQNNPPNFVFIIMESLSSAFCGTNAYMGNFTPFLDSLINHSLYWENFLSTSERTFNTIPSLFGSLPYGEKGFMELVKPDETINHTTFIKWLNQHGYFSSFYYGGWTGFDNMENFLKYQDIDFILKYFGDHHQPIEKDKKGFSWGYPDHALFSRSLEVIDSLNKNPRLDIYLTISLHHPFNPSNKNYYLQKFEKQLKDLKLAKSEKDEIRNYTDIFATVLYTDDALKNFIHHYKKRKEFENTIFIITGDHRLGTQNTRNALDKYHVPFIIYSPMLKKAVKFSSVSSHLNVTPTLYPFMAKNFGFKMPKKVHWLGSQIDTTKNFRNIHQIPLMKTNREIDEFIFKHYLLTKSGLFKLKKGLNTQYIEHKNIEDSIKQSLTNFVIVNNYITQNNLLLSDE